MDQLLPGDILSNILNYLPWKEVVRCRLISRQWRSAANSCRCDISVADHSRMAVIADCFSTARSLEFTDATELDDSKLHQARNFHQLHRLVCCKAVCLERAMGQTIAAHFPHLHELNLTGNSHLDWQLRDLRALPQLYVLRAAHNLHLKGNLGDLIPDLFSVLEFSWCPNVTGNIKQLAQFPFLEELSLNRTQVVGDLRKVTREDFPSLQEVGLGDCDVYGVGGDVQYVSHAAGIMLGRYHMTRLSTATCPIAPFALQLSRDSPDFYYGRVQQRLYASEWDPPFSLETIVAGTRRGYRWSNLLGGSCDIVWFDPEPVEGDLAEYRSDLEMIQGEGSSIFAGLTEPPTQQRYCEISQIHDLV